jgi:hypothetical protein
LYREERRIQERIEVLVERKAGLRDLIVPAVRMVVATLQYQAERAEPAGEAPVKMWIEILKLASQGVRITTATRGTIPLDPIISLRASPMMSATQAQSLPGYGGVATQPVQRGVPTTRIQSITMQGPDRTRIIEGQDIPEFLRQHPQLGQSAIIQYAPRQ